MLERLSAALSGSPSKVDAALASISTSLSVPHRGLAKNLLELGQSHLFAGWSEPDPADIERFFAKVEQLESSYPGGLRAYVGNARKLLADSKAGVNPLEGWKPSIPTGETLEYGSAEFVKYEEMGAGELEACGFILVAGGLGERLGFSGIKVALPTQTTTDESYLSLYIRSILAMQQRAAKTSGHTVALPLAIMVSDDTAARTEELLKANDYYGLKPEQVTLLKQEKVACLQDNEARLALDPKDKFTLLTKPHGHGDIHFLMHESGTAKRWKESGIRWVYFMQDTNALVMKVLAACLGVSKALNLQVNSVCVPRAPGESIGGIMTLKHKDGRSMTVNVEYNQIDALLKATIEPKGDVAGEDGMSPWPGSINQLLFALEPYADQLEKSKGKMPEFVNPKYTDGTKTAFKSPTRLECMMQDYPKSLPPQAPVGFCVVKGITFSPVKNNLAEARKKSAADQPTHSAASGEADSYASACEILVAAGVHVPEPKVVARAGVKVQDWPRVVVDPSFGVVLSDWREKLVNPGAVSLSPGSTLVLQGDLNGLRIESLSVKGTLVVRMCEGAKVTLKNVKVDNRGWSFVELREGEQTEEQIAIRGYKLVKHSQRELVYEKPGEYVVDDVTFKLRCVEQCFNPPTD